MTTTLPFSDHPLSTRHWAGTFVYTSFELRKSPLMRSALACIVDYKMMPFMLPPRIQD